MKKKIKYLFNKRKIALSLTCALLMLGLVIGCTKKEDTIEDKLTKEDELTKEEILNIEKQYYNSELVLNINSYSRISDRGLVIITDFETPSKLSNKIFEFVNSKGEIQNAVSLSVESTKSNSYILLQSLDEKDIKFSSILFKNKNYNGINVSFVGTESEIKRLEKYVEQNKTINLKNSDTTISVEIIYYFVDYVNDSYNTLNLIVIADDNIVFSDLLTIEGYSLNVSINNYVE